MGERRSSYRQEESKKLQQFADQTGASAVRVLEKSIELFLAADEAKAKAIPFPNRSGVHS